MKVELTELLSFVNGRIRKAENDLDKAQTEEQREKIQTRRVNYTALKKLVELKMKEA